MNRSTLVEKIYQRGHLLSLKNSDYEFRFKCFIAQKLKEDLGHRDLTSEAVINPGTQAEAKIAAREPGILCGAEEVALFYRINGIEVSLKTEDGKPFESGSEIMRLKGQAQKLLTLERSGLNIIRRMSGIATLTSKYSDKLEKFQAQIAATRKTTMDEHLEKRAVFTGGGLTHRLGLDDFIMIKDCHLDLIRKEGIKNSLAEALKRAFNSEHGRAVEIETASKDEALEAAEALTEYDKDRTPAVIMLDNMSPESIKETLREMKKQGFYDQIIFEASGGITSDNLIDYAETGTDVISTGALTENACKIDLHQKIL